MSIKSPINEVTDVSENRSRSVLVSDSARPDAVDTAKEEKTLRRKVDIRLCTIAGLLCSLDLLDSGLISSASVTSMLSDLGLDQGNRFSVSILIFTVSGVCFQLPATIAVRLIGPRIFFSFVTFGFGLISLVGPSSQALVVNGLSSTSISLFMGLSLTPGQCTAFVHTWKQMIAMRVLLGIFMAGIYPGLALLISSWYKRDEQQLRFAYLQSGEIIVLATGGIANYGLNHLHGQAGLKGWQWMFLVQGLITCIIGIATYFWIVDFPENAHRSFYFLNKTETDLAVRRIQDDRGDVKPAPFSVREIARHFLDLKIYGFAATFFLLNLVSTALSYFLPIILQNGMGFSANKAILLSAPPYYYAVIPVLLSSLVGDRYRLRAPVITFNSLCLIVGFAMLGFADQVTVRYIGTFLATGAYISNWAALNSYQANNITGQWKRAVSAATITACNGLGGVAGAFIVRQKEAPRYFTAIWVSIGSHVFIMAIIAVFTLHFISANRKQRIGTKLIEGTDGFRYTC